MTLIGQQKENRDEPQGASSTLWHPPCGDVIPNRIAKAAMEENMADADHLPGRTLQTLYEQWSRGGAGLIISGNVMIDPAAMTGPRGVVLEPSQPLAPFVEWAKAAHAGGGRAWLRINRPGRQTPRGPWPAGRSRTLDDQGPDPRARGPLSHPAPFAKTRSTPSSTSSRRRRSSWRRPASRACRSTLRTATLISQFLSPLANARTDGWGGALDQRSRFLFEVVRAVRARVLELRRGRQAQRGRLPEGRFRRSRSRSGGEQAGGHGGRPRRALPGGTYESPAMQGRAAAGPGLSMRRLLRRACPDHRSAGHDPGHGHGGYHHAGCRGGRRDAGLRIEPLSRWWASPAPGLRSRASAEVARRRNGRDAGVALSVEVADGRRRQHGDGARPDRRLGRGARSGVCASPMWALAARSFARRSPRAGTGDGSSSANAALPHGTSPGARSLLLATKASRAEPGASLERAGPS